MAPCAGCARTIRPDILLAIAPVKTIKFRPLQSPVIATLALVALAALIGAIVMWKPPSSSGDVASWVQAFGSVAAIMLAVYLQHSAGVERKNDQLLARVQATNSAIALSAGFCNLTLALRKQHTRPALDALVRAKSDFQEFLGQRARGQRQGNAAFVWEPDLSSFTAPAIPIEILLELVVKGSFAHARAVGAVLQIEQAYDGLRKSMASRELLVQRLASGEIPNDRHPHYLLGLPLPEGGTNREYPDLVRVIDEHAADLTFFAALLCDDLSEHGNRLHSLLDERFRSEAPKVALADFMTQRTNGTIPPASQYTAWLGGFIGKPG